MIAPSESLESQQIDWLDFSWLILRSKLKPKGALLLLGFVVLRRSFRCRRPIKLPCGITGTRQGMTPAQKSTSLRRLLEEARVTSDGFVHGAGVGVDVEAHAIARGLGFKTECWPLK